MMDLSFISFIFHVYLICLDVDGNCDGSHLEQLAWVQRTEKR